MKLEESDLGLSNEQLKRLQLASSAAVAEAVRTKCDKWLHRSYVDSDDLFYAGTALGRSGHDGIEQVVWRWLQQDPIERRWDTAALILWGYWRFARNVDVSVVNEVRAQLKKLSRRSDAYGSILLALSSVFFDKKASMSADFFREGRRYLSEERRMLEKQGLHKGVADTLADLGVA